MPSKLDDTSNLHFLYACLESGQPKRVDFQQVAKEFGLSVPAARMRYRRLQAGLGGKQGDRVSKPKSAAVNRKAQRSGKKSGAKEGLEMKWKGAEDGDDDDDEEITAGKIEGDGGKMKKEESDDDYVWKALPEAVPSSTPVEAQAQATVLSPPSAPLHRDSVQVQPQMLFHNTPRPATNPTEGSFLRSSGGYVHTSAHVAMPQMDDSQTFPADYQPNYLQ